jgi:hypothetical protein
MLDVGDMADPTDSPGKEPDAAVDTPTGNDIFSSHDEDEIDIRFTPPTGVESTLAFTAEDPLPQGQDIEAGRPDPDVIPNHTDAATMPAESGEIDLNNEHFSPSFERVETDLASAGVDDLDVLETNLPAVPLSAPIDDVNASTEAAFADFLPLQSEELALPSLSTQEQVFDDDPDATMVDGTNELTLADEVFDLSLPTQEITHVETQELTQDQVPRDDDFALPAPPLTREQELDPPQDAAPADEDASPTMTDDAFVLPAPPTQEVTLVDTQEATQEQLPQDDDFALPPLPMQDLTATHPQDATVADDESSRTLLDGMFNRPAELTQELTLTETQEGARIEDDLRLHPTGDDPAAGTPPPNPEEEDDEWLDNDVELEFGDELPPSA